MQTRGEQNSQQQHDLLGIRSDNEPVLKSQEWLRVCNQNNVTPQNSSPYSPSQNGKCERMVQSIKNALKATTNNVDPYLWCFALEQVARVWNMRRSVNRHGLVCSPNDILSEISDNPLQLVEGRPILS